MLHPLHEFVLRQRVKVKVNGLRPTLTRKQAGESWTHKSRDIPGLDRVVVWYELTLSMLD